MKLLRFLSDAYYTIVSNWLMFGKRQFTCTVVTVDKL